MGHPDVGHPPPVLERSRVISERESPSHTSDASGAEARFPSVRALRHDWKSCPSRSFVERGFVERSGKSQQQVPHRAFGPVRNDKGLVGVFAALEVLFHP
jgi:hypothetical protein